MIWKEQSRRQSLKKYQIMFEARDDAAAIALSQEKRNTAVIDFNVYRIGEALLIP